MRRIATVACVAVVALVAGCGGDSQTYSVEETKAAFARHGYVLETARLPTAGLLERDGQAALTPRDGSSFFVVVTTDSEADRVWPDYERMQDDDSFDVRRANVVLIADDGVSANDRRSVLAALEALPDRDVPVLVAGD